MPSRLLVYLVLGMVACKTLRGVDISPNEPNGLTADGNGRPAGIVIALVGDEAELFAVSLNAGVWRSRNGAAWQQLANSPPRAYSIALDPTRRGHIAVGERDGNHLDATQNQSGVWESFDSGDTFTFVPPNNHCGSQAIPSLTFTSDGKALIAGTACGLAVRSAGSWAFPVSPVGTVTAVAASATNVWARAADRTLVVSIDDGNHFKLATTTTLPAGLDNAPGSGDDFSLAAFDDFAVMSTVGPEITGDDNKDLGNNFNQLLICAPAANPPWIVLTHITDPANPNKFPNGKVEFILNGSANGTGGSLSGDRFLRAFESDDGCSQLRAKIASDTQEVLAARASLGNGTGSESKATLQHIGTLEAEITNLKAQLAQCRPKQTLFFSSGQDLFRAQAPRLDPNNLVWSRVGSSYYATAPVNPSFLPTMHPDFWAVNLTPTGTTWLGEDGGVFVNKMDGTGWKTQNDGLHTHHAHMLFGAPSNAAHAYTTTDNSTWFAGPNGNWLQDGSADSIWITGDPLGNPPFTLANGHWPGIFVQGYDHNVPGQSGPTWNVPGAGNQAVDGPFGMHIVETLASGDIQQPANTVDLVMIPKSSPQILRNKTWLQNADAGVATGQGWKVMADNVPLGTQAFLVAGGHKNTMLYVISSTASDGSADLDLWRWDGQQQAHWTKLWINGTGQPNNLVRTAPFGQLTFMDGPLFVNPYQADMIFALTTSGVRVSTDGGFHWSDETALTKAVTGNFSFPWKQTFDGGNGSFVQTGSHGQWGGLFALCSMSFDAYHPARMAAASPFTGVFLNAGDGVWQDLSSALPKPYTPVSSIYLSGSAVDVALQGRSLWQIQGLPDCIPTTCAAQGKACGVIPDGCGKTIACSGCAGSQVCRGSDGGPAANTCCTPTTCAAKGMNCGITADGCGGELKCGFCTAPKTCGSISQPNVCH